MNDHESPWDTMSHHERPWTTMSTWSPLSYGENEAFCMLLHQSMTGPCWGGGLEVRPALSNTTPRLGPAEGSGSQTCLIQHYSIIGSCWQGSESQICPVQHNCCSYIPSAWVSDMCKGGCHLPFTGVAAQTLKASKLFALAIHAQGSVHQVKFPSAAQHPRQANH